MSEQSEISATVEPLGDGAALSRHQVRHQVRDEITVTKMVTLSHAVEVNPKLDRSLLNDDLDVSFVPMAAVEALSGGIDVSTIRKYAEVKKGYTHFRDGDILFAKVTPCMENGKMAIARKLVNGVGFGSTEFHVLRPRAGVDARYIYYFVSSQTFRKEASGHMTGAVGLRRVPSAYLEEQLISLPDIERQREIVAELEKQFSRLDEAVANLQRVKANLKRYRASVLKDAVEGRLVPLESELARREGRSFETGELLLQRILEVRRSQWKGKNKFKEPVVPDVSVLRASPAGWAWATYAQVGDVTTGFTPPTGDVENFGGNVPFFKPSDLDVGENVTVAREYLSEKGIAKGRLLKADSVLVTCIGATIGKTGLAGVDCATNQQINAVSPAEGGAVPSFVYHWTISLTGQAQILDNSSATTLPILNKSKFEALGVPLPPKAEQLRIVAEADRRLSLVRGVESEIDADLKRAQSLRQSTLSKAFSANQ